MSKIVLSTKIKDIKFKSIHKYRFLIECKNKKTMKKILNNTWIEYYELYVVPPDIDQNDPSKTLELLVFLDNYSHLFEVYDSRKYDIKKILAKKITTIEKSYTSKSRLVETHLIVDRGEKGFFSIDKNGDKIIVTKFLWECGQVGNSVVFYTETKDTLKDLLNEFDLYEYIEYPLERQIKKPVRASK